MIRLVATDVDGTLMVPGTSVPEGNRAALREAHGRGVGIALATVRVRSTAIRIAEEIGVPCGLVTEGGAVVHDAAGRLLREVTIPLDLAREIAAAADAEGVGLLTTLGGRHRWGPGYVSGLPSVARDPERFATNLATIEGPPTRFMVTGDRGVALLLGRFGGAGLRIVRHYRADGSLIDAAVTAAGGTKEAGLAALCEHLGIPFADVMAVGDAESDAGMLRAAGVGVAVEDAAAEAREAADWIAPAAAAWGVAAAIRRYVAGG